MQWALSVCVVSCTGVVQEEAFCGQEKLSCSVRVTEVSADILSVLKPKAGNI